MHGARSVGIAGGVSANSRLRADARRAARRARLPVFIPSLALSTDNAAMIAAAGTARTIAPAGTAPVGRQRWTAQNATRFDRRRFV